MARSRTEVWTSQPPGPQRIAAKWRSRIISAWYPNSRVDVVRGVPLTINGSGIALAGDKLNLAAPNDTSAYANLGYLTPPNDLTRISSLTIATPSSILSTRNQLFSTGNDSSVHVGFGLLSGYSTNTSAFFYNDAKFVAEGFAGTFATNQRAIYGTSYDKAGNAATVYKNGKSLGSGSFDTAIDVSYRPSDPYCVGGRCSTGTTKGWSGSIELLVLSPTIWSAAEFAAFVGANVWAELFEPLWMRVYSLPGVNNNQNITAPLGSLALTQLLPTLTQGNSVASPLGSLTLSGFAPVFNQTEGIVAPLGAITLTELLPTFSQGNGIVAPLGSLTLTELVPAFNQTEGIVAPLGTLTLNELLPAFVQAGDQSITAPLGAIVLNELPPSFTQSTPITPIAGGGSGGGGGGKRQLEKEIRELPLFKKLEARKPGQSIQDVLSEPDEVPSPKPLKPVIPEVRKQVVEARAEVEPKKEPESPALKIINERLDEIKQELKTLRARAEAEGLPINTEEDDAEILLILSALL